MKAKHGGEVKLKIHPELAALMPDHEIDELTQLRQNLEADGVCINPVIVWEGTDYVVEGHQRYALCTELGIPFKVLEKEFDSIEAVKLWMVTHQRGRRNWTEDQYALALATAMKLKPAPEGRPMSGAQAKESENPINTESKSTNCGKSTVSDVASESGIDRAALTRASKVLEQGSEQLNQAVADGDIDLKKAARIADKPKSVQNRILKQKSPQDAKAVKPKKSKKKPAPPKAENTKDEVGNEIPAELRSAFDARSDFDAALNHLKQISTITNKLMGNAMENVKGTPGGEHLERDQIRKSINYLTGAISFMRPYAICPRHSDKGKCLVCGGLGWVVKHTYKNSGVK